MTRYWSKEEFKAKLMEKGRLYHIHHPVHRAMNNGECTKEQIRAWVSNRFYYQISIPRKDAAIMANCESSEVRREWAHRITDHDSENGGIHAWIRLGEACGIPREEIVSLKRVLPGVRFAVDAYVNFASKAVWQEAVCSSLTELFAPEIHQKRLDTWPEHYKWIDPEGLGYFRKRLSEARRDVEHGLEVTLDYFVTEEAQRKALNILQFKLDVLWSLLDSIQLAYFFNNPPYHNVE